MVATGRLACLAGLLLCLVPPTRGAAEPGDALAPYFSRNQSPIIQIHGLPGAEPGTVVPPGETELRLTFNAANNYAREFADAEWAIFDGETYRFDTSIRYGFAKRWELGIDIPVVSHQGGAFDSFIIDWHNTFGMTQGGRTTEVGKDELRFYYQKDNEARLELYDNTGGVGDLMLLLGCQLWRGRNGSGACARWGLKLPTGDSGDLTGSGATDTSLSAWAETRPRVAGREASFYGGAGVLLVGEGDVLEDQQEPVVWFGSVGLAWYMFSWIAPKFQFDMHSRFYDQSDLDQVGKWSIQIVTGAALRLPWRTALDVTVVEDIDQDTSPDVVFHIALRKRL